MTIWADPGTNALVINAPERIRQDMLAVVNQIDIPRLQVQVDAIIVELSEEKTAQLGVTWLSAGRSDVVRPHELQQRRRRRDPRAWRARPRATRRTSAAIAEGITIGVGKITRHRRAGRRC